MKVMEYEYHLHCFLNALFKNSYRVYKIVIEYIISLKGTGFSGCHGMPPSLFKHEQIPSSALASLKSL